MDPASSTRAGRTLTGMSATPGRDEVGRQAAEQDVVGRAVLRVVLHPHPLEVLDGVGVAVLQLLLELLADRVAEERQRLAGGEARFAEVESVGVPVRAEPAAEVMPRLREVFAALLTLLRRRRERR